MKPFAEMNDDERNDFNEAYLALYEAFTGTQNPDEAARLKSEMIQMEVDAGLYGQL